jgi:hypothetical protein
MSNPNNFTPGTGRLVTDRFQFENHLQGTNPPGSSGFRHTADQIDMQSVLISGDTTVQETLASIVSSISGGSAYDLGFITVPNTYDTYANANGTINFNNQTPSLDTFLNPIFTAITNYQNNYTAVPAQFERIKDGGIVIIQAGTYIVKQVISIPPGISIVGEGYGTKIVNATGLNTSASPPHLSGAPSPVFLIQSDPNRATNDGAINNTYFAFERETKISNLVLCDNFVDPTLLGDTNYLLAQNTSATTPLIQQTSGSNLCLDRVFIIGRTTSGTTSSAVYLNASVSAPNGTILRVENSTLDGFSVPIQYSSSPSGSATVNTDYLTLRGCAIRAFGGLSSNVSSPQDNCFILMNDNNANICDNDFYGMTNIVTSLVYMQGHISGTPNFGARSKILVSNNNVQINRSSNVSNTSFSTFSAGYSNLSTYSSILHHGNNFQDSYGISIDGISIFSANTTGVTFKQAASFNGGISYNINPMSGSILSCTIGSPAQITVSSNIINNNDIICVFNNNYGINGYWAVSSVGGSTSTFTLTGSTATMGSILGSFAIVSHNALASDYLIMPNTAINPPALPIASASSQQLVAFTAPITVPVPSSLSLSIAANAINAPIFISGASHSVNDGYYPITAYIPPASGTTASINISGGYGTLTNAPSNSFQPDSAGQKITISNATGSNNNGTFLIYQYVSSTSVIYINGSGAAGNDPNNGSISFSVSALFAFNNSAALETGFDTVSVSFGNVYNVILPAIPSSSPYPAYLIKNLGTTTSGGGVILTGQTGTTFDINGENTASISTGNAFSVIGYGSEWVILDE